MCYAKKNEPPPSSEAVIVSDTPSDTSHPEVMKDYSQVGNAMVTMADMMQTFIEMAYRKFCQMSDQMDVARNAQNMIKQMKITLSQLKKPDEIGRLPAGVINYLQEKNILVDEQTIDEFLHQHTRIGRVAQDGQFCLFAGIPASAMASIKTALESFADEASDIVQHSQQRQMQLMKDFNNALTMTSSLQSINASSVKSIEQSIR
ncbi:hypothetical protein SC171_21425 [Pantoea cypripedii]|uniref:hypothetical protein n=1 Tax=Pantoea cypripedii TaxID=55209 RepID=UPI002FCA9E0F